ELGADAGEIAAALHLGLDRGARDGVAVVALEVEERLLPGWHGGGARAGAAQHDGQRDEGANGEDAGEFHRGLLEYRWVALGESAGGRVSPDAISIAAEESASHTCWCVGGRLPGGRRRPTRRCGRAAPGRAPLSPSRRASGAAFAGEVVH